MNLPIVAVSGSLMSLKDEDENFLGYEYAYVANNYINAVSKSGATPIILPVVSDEKTIKNQLEIADALILTGGYDVNPHFYNEEPSKKMGKICTARDEFDLKLIEIALELKKPILGICRGMQILNVYFGGTLYQDLSYNNESHIEHNQKAHYSEGTHFIKIEEGSFLYKISEKNERVNSFHHQAINDLADNFKAIAFANDGVIEAIENKGKDSIILGVQFHPEMMFEKNEFAQKIFKAFIDEIKKI